MTGVPRPDLIFSTFSETAQSTETLNTRGGTADNIRSYYYYSEFTRIKNYISSCANKRQKASVSFLSDLRAARTEGPCGAKRTGLGFTMYMLGPGRHPPTMPPPPPLQHARITEREGGL